MKTRFFFTVEGHSSNSGPCEMTNLQIDLSVPLTEANLTQLEKNMIGALTKDGHPVSNIQIFDYKVLTP